MNDAATLVEALRRRGWSLATAESLTGGLVCAELTAVPGSSAVVLGGVVAYATELKAVLLDVARDLLAAHGPVHPEVAAAMAEGVRRRLGADVGVATTGVAGPARQGESPVGRVYVAVASPNGRRVEELSLQGERDQIRRRSVDRALALATSMI